MSKLVTSNNKTACEVLWTSCPLYDLDSREMFVTARRLSFGEDKGGQSLFVTVDWKTRSSIAVRLTVGPIDAYGGVQSYNKASVAAITAVLAVAKRAEQLAHEEVASSKQFMLN